MSAPSPVVQVAMGLTAVLVMWGLTRWAKSDATQRIKGYTGTSSSRTRVLDGVINADAFNKKSWNTVNAGSPAYLPMFRSVNRLGGAQFSFSTWVYVDRMQSLGGAPYTLFLRGDDRQYDFKRATVTPGEAPRFDTLPTLKDRTTVCPMVQLSADGGITLVFNTTTDLSQRVELKPVSSRDSSVRTNVPSITPKRWVLLTVVFQDNVPLADFENGLNVRVYINDFVYKEEQFAKTALVQNDGRFHLLPDGAPQSGTGLRLSDLSYHNHALNDADVARLYSKGPSLHEHRVEGKKAEDILLTSAFNSTDLYNF
jgi:hypothetical protein